MHRELLTATLAAFALAGCGSDALEAGRAAVEGRRWEEAVLKLRPAARAEGASEEVTKLYEEALKGYRAELRDTRTKAEACDRAFEGLSKVDGFGQEGREAVVLTQALLCAARERARSKQGDEAARVVVAGMDRHPGFDGGSPVLEKALEGPAQAAARAGKVREASALAQVLYGSGKQGLALSVLDLLEGSGASPEAILAVLRERHEKAPSSDAAAGLAAGYAAWRGHADEAARWYDEVVRRVETGASAAEVHLKSYAKARAEQAQALADAREQDCAVVKARFPLSAPSEAIGATSAAGTEGGALLAWIQGDKAPGQQVLALRVGWDGTPGQPVTVVERVLEAEPPSPDDPQGAFAPKNREVSLAIQPCGGTVELAARGAPLGGWMRATLGPDGQVASPAARLSRLGETGRMPSEDVWWSVGCSNDQLVHVWLADTQLMRLAWLSAGEPQGEPSNLRLSGFAPAFAVRGGEAGATLVTWVDILGEGASQIVYASIPEDRTVAVDEEAGAVAAQPVAEGIDGRVEQMRVVAVGERFAVVWVPQGGDFGVRWVDPSGRPLGQVAALVEMRSDAQDVRFGAAGTPSRLAVAWTERLTEGWSALYFRASTSDGNPASRVQRVAGLARPDVAPLVVGSAEGQFLVAWVDRSAPEGERLVGSLLRCGG